MSNSPVRDSSRRSSGSSSSNSDVDVENGNLLLTTNEKGEMTIETSKPPAKKGTSIQFLVWTVINTFATIGIVSTVK